MPSTASETWIMIARRSVYRFTSWHSWHFGILRTLRPTSEGSSFLGGQHPRILVWFSVECIYRADLNQDYMGRWKEKTMKYACIFCIICIFGLENAESAESVAVSVNIFQELPRCIPCTLAHFENAKVSRMPRGNLEIIRILHLFIPWWSWPPDCAKVQEMQGVAMKKNIIMATRKWSDILCRARYLLRFSKGVIHSRWSVSVIIVTTVIAMKKGNEKKGIARVCFGRYFIPKSLLWNRSHCRDCSLFFSPP